MHYLISPIGISDGSFAAEEVPGGADKIFRARHQPRPGKLDSSGVGKPPLLLRRWGKVIREWDLRKARKAFIFSRFRATRRHWNSCLRVLPLYHGQNNFCKKINVTRMNIWMDRKGVSAATFVQEYFNVRYSYFSFSSVFFPSYLSFLPRYRFSLSQSLSHHLRWLVWYLRRSATSRDIMRRKNVSLVYGGWKGAWIYGTRAAWKERGNPGCLPINTNNRHIWRRNG